MSNEIAKFFCLRANFAELSAFFLPNFPGFYISPSLCGKKPQASACGFLYKLL